MHFSIDDITLIPSLHQGMPAAYETIYHHFARSLRFFAEQLVKDRHVAEDIAAEAFIRTFKKHKDFQSLDKLKAFLFITANNAALDYLKQQKRHDLAHQEIKYLAEGEMDDMELAYIKAETTRAIHAAIELLPEQPRKVIRMAFVEGMKLPDIAAELNLSYNTVQNYRGRGLELIRNHLIRKQLLTAKTLWLAFALLERH